MAPLTPGMEGERSKNDALFHLLMQKTYRQSFFFFAPKYVLGACAPSASLAMPLYWTWYGYFLLRHGFGFDLGFTAKNGKIQSCPKHNIELCFLG